MDLHDIFQGRYTDYKWRQLGEYLKGNQINAGEGIRLENSTSSGSIISAIPSRQIKQSQAPPFSVLSLRKVPDSDQYAAQLQEGWVIDRDSQQGSDAVIFHEVELDEFPMSLRPRREILLDSGDFVMVRYFTDINGHLTSTPVIIVGEEEESEHYQPPSGESAGSTGSYYVKLFEFTINDGSPKIIVHQQSDIEHSRLWSGRNVGGARNVHKERNGPADKYDFRTLEQFEPEEGSNPDFGKIIVDPVGNENDAENDAIKFSCISERDKSPQINIDDNGAGTITVKGNNNNGSLFWAYCEDDENGISGQTLLTWEDGLITNTEPFPTITAGCGGLPEGYSGEILYHNGTDWVTLANPGQNPNGEGFVLTSSGVFPEWLPYDGDDF